jgi:hypothetical protein
MVGTTRSKRSLLVETTKLATRACSLERCISGALALLCQHIGDAEVVFGSRAGVHAPHSVHEWCSRHDRAPLRALQSSEGAAHETRARVTLAKLQLLTLRQSETQESIASWMEAAGVALVVCSVAPLAWQQCRRCIGHLSHQLDMARPTVLAPRRAQA